jgi:hypothetical protein
MFGRRVKGALKRFITAAHGFFIAVVIIVFSSAHSGFLLAASEDCVMPDSQKEDRVQFASEYGECIAHIANNWATLEYSINATIWILAGTAPALGACITSQIPTLFGRLNALLSIMKLRRVDQNLINKVNKFSDTIREPQELRNRAIHDVWFGRI